MHLAVSRPRVYERTRAPARWRPGPFSAALVLQLAGMALAVAHGERLIFWWACAMFFPPTLPIGYVTCFYESILHQQYGVLVLLTAALIFGMTALAERFDSSSL